MNTAIVRFIIGHVLRIEGILMILPIVTSVIYQEPEGIKYVIVAAICFVLGSLMTIPRPKNTVFYLKEGCVTTALSWIVMSIFGALPFMMTGEIPSFVDAFFETVSGFTTTGSSILSDVEALSHTSLIWRSFTHWVGGMGVLVFLLAILPLTGGSNINLMKAESPGPSVGKLVPKIRSSARILYLIYFGMTIIQIVLLLIAKMPLFDTLCMTFGSAGTGGFGIRNDSAASYTMSQQWIIGIFMMLFGVNFNFYYFLLHKEPKKSFAMEEVRWYFIIILFSTGVIFTQIISKVGNVERALRQAFFQVSSIITTTGFSSVNFDKWDSVAKMILVTLMFIGACAGSTGGGLKVSRVIIMVKTFLKEIGSYMHPKCVKKIKMDGEAIEHDVIRSTNVYFITYFMIFVVSLFIVCFDGKDLITSFTAVAATFNNIGPGLAKVGPNANFGGLSDLSKIVLSFDMLFGRLELFPMIILFHPGVWKETFISKKKIKEHRMMELRQKHNRA